MIELLSTAEMDEADRLAVAGGVPGIALMENAGRAVADLLCSTSDGRNVAVVAGPGNNGGDGFVAARHLAERGRDVTVLFVGDRNRHRGDAAEAARRWNGPVKNAAPDMLEGCDSIVDALFGAGLDRNIGGPPAAMIAGMNASAKPVVAIDLPSGVNGTTGKVMGVAIRAERTITFFRRKSGHLLLPGRLLCGEVEIADIGIADKVLTTINPRTFVNCPELWIHVLPQPRLEGHKYARGHVVSVSGGPSSTGAARLAARGALRAGAGLVTIASPREALAINAAASLAVMVRPVDGAGELTAFLSDRRRNAVVVGPGGGVGPAMREQVEAVLMSNAVAVLDADALTSFADDPASLAAAVRQKPERPVVLTPHGGEFNRLFRGLPKISNSGSKLEESRLASRETSAFLVLKGADTVIAAPDGRAAISENAPATLATAGAGDVLAGMIAGLMAQGMPPFEAASAAVWLHGEAAGAFGAGLISEDLPDMLPDVYRRLLAMGSSASRPY